MQRTKTRASADKGSVLAPSRPTSSEGGDRTYWRIGTSGRTRSTKRSARSCTLRGGRRRKPSVRPKVRTPGPSEARSGDGYAAGAAARTDSSALAGQRKSTLGAALSALEADEAAFLRDAAPEVAVEGGGHKTLGRCLRRLRATRRSGATPLSPEDEGDRCADLVGRWRYMRWTPVRRTRAPCRA